MSAKISEAVWKAFTRKQKLELDDRELLKALARFDKTDEQKPEARLEVLQHLMAEIPKQLAALVRRKNELGDKPFSLVKGELQAMLEEAEAVAKAARLAAAAGEQIDEDAAAAALVNPKQLYRQLSLCHQDPARRVQFAFVDARDKQPALLALHPRLAARALFAELQSAAGASTGAYGMAWLDGSSLILQLDKPLSGLARKVRAPVRASGFKIAKAVLWNADGTVFEQDDADVALDQMPGDAGAGAVQTPGDAVGGAGAAQVNALEDWRVQRAAAIGALKEVAGRIAAARHASSAQAIIELQAVIKNLTAEPSTLQQATELRRYLDTDEVVRDVCDLAQDIRTPLLGALDRLRTRLSG